MTDNQFVIHSFVPTIKKNQFLYTPIMLVRRITL